MGFASFAEEEARQGKEMRGNYRKAAVGCWFTSGGKAIPKIVKYEDDDGCVHTLRDVQILCAGQRYYGGLPVREFRCRVIQEEREIRFCLFYHPDSATWDLLPEAH